MTHLTEEQIARSNFVIYQSDESGAIQSLTGTQQFVHAETGITYPASTFREPLERLRNIWLFKVNRNTPQDSRWFENIAPVHSLNLAAPEVRVSYTADLKPFGPDLIKETKARIWADADQRLLLHDRSWPRAQEFSETQDAEIVAYRASLEDAYNDAIVDCDAATDTASLGRAEAKYDAAVAALDVPDPNPWLRP